LAITAVRVVAERAAVVRVVVAMRVVVRVRVVAVRVGILWPPVAAIAGILLLQLLLLLLQLLNLSLDLLDLRLQRRLAQAIATEARRSEGRGGAREEREGPDSGPHRGHDY